MRIITGDDTGLLKSIRLEAQKIEKLGEWRRGDAAERLCWGGPAADRESRFLAAYESGLLESRDGATGRVLCSTKLSAPKVRCLETLGDRVLAVCQDGSANVVANWCGETAPEPPPEEAEEENEEKKEGKATAADGEGEDKKAPRGPGHFELQGPIAAAQVDPCNTGRLVFGGGENDIKIWDLEKQKVTWKAKNMKENFLCLRIPLKISTLAWATEVAPSRSMILCGTTDGKIRLYDSKTQRRPLFELTIGFMAGGGTGGHTGVIDDLPRPSNCFAVANTRGGTAWSLFVGNTMGMLREYDLRNLATVQTAQVCPGRKSHMKWAVKQMPFRRVYPGMMGSIRSVDVHPSGETLAAVGLGRFAYIFDVKKKQMTEKVFLKQKLCSVLFSSEERKVSKADDESDDEDKDHEKAGEAEAEEGADDEVQAGFSSDEDGGGPEGEDDESEEGAGEGGEEEEAEDDSDEDDEECQEEAATAAASAGSGAAGQAKGKRRRASERPADTSETSAGGRKKRRGRGAS